jgi:hypothetical protein
MISYDEHLAWITKEMDKTIAEWNGVHRAKLGDCVRYSKDPDIQARFEKGYQDGCAKLMQDKISSKTD